MTVSPKLGVVIVTYNASEVIRQCLESLLTAPGAGGLAIVVVDNASPDGTADLIERWARGEAEQAPDPASPVPLRAAPKPLPLAIRAPGEVVEGSLTLIRWGLNRGFAYGVNRGLEALKSRDDVAAFWVLNPDCVAPPETPGRLRDFAFSERFGLAGGRCRFYQRPDIVQTDGGKVSRSTGVCRGIHAGCPAAETPLPADDELDFISGAHLLVSRDYLDTVGLMPEDYFLYYEEVDWAYRRGTFALRVVPGADIFHRGGASIGSGTFVRAPNSFANYFNHRNRMWFVRRHLTGRSSRALVWSFAKTLQVLARDGWPEAWALMKGVLGLAPPRRVRRSVADAAARAHAFPPSPHGPLRIIYKFCIKIFGSIS